MYCTASMKMIWRLYRTVLSSVDSDVLDSFFK